MAAKRKIIALILIMIVDAGYIAWGAMAALAPDHLLGSGSLPILAAEYKGFTGHSWPELASASPMTTNFVTVIFRVYGAYNVVFGLMAAAIALTAFRRGERWARWTLFVGHTIALGSAMKFDWTMNAIGPFEMTEYLGLVLIYTALAMTASFAGGLPVKAWAARQEQGIIPFTPLAKQLSESTVALVSTAGIARNEDRPFDQ